MTLSPGYWIAALSVASLMFAFSAPAAQPGAGGAQSPAAEIDLRADKLSTGNGSNQIEASGNVEIKREATTLKADEVRFNRATQEIEAKGRVRIDDPEWKIKSADSLKLNMGQETGEIENGDLFLEQGHISISGRRFEKFGGQSYHVDDGFFTTCLCESGAPSWKFSAEQMDLALDGVGTIKNGYFYVLDVPVFYLPYGYFPLNTERQTGFLFPKFGHSSKDGPTAERAAEPARRAPTQPSNSISRRKRASVSSASIGPFSIGILIFKSIHLISTNRGEITPKTRSLTGLLPIRPFPRIAGASSALIATRHHPIGSRSATLRLTETICLPVN